jgi:signal transduction histidine kinase
MLCHLVSLNQLAGPGCKQTNVSRLEKRADMKLSTLRDYVEALGGTLQIVADVAGTRVDLSSVAQRSRHVRSKRATGSVRV